MVRVRRIAAGALAGIVLALAAGCGGGDDGGEQADAYVDEVNAAQQAFSDRVEQIGAGGDDEQALAAFSDAADQAATDIRGIEPPEEVAELHGRLVRGFDDFARETAAAEDAITSGDLDRVLAAQEDMLEATETQQRLIRTTVAQINAELG